MGLHIRYMVTAIVIGAISLLGVISPASAQSLSGPDDPTPITFSGTVTNFGAPVEGYTVVAWCSGDLDKFGGSDSTDEHGFFEIHTTNGANCPLGDRGFLEIYHDGAIVGSSGDVFIHTQTTVNLKLEGGNPISVPEFGWVGGVASLAAAGGVIALARRRFARRFPA